MDILPIDFLGQGALLQPAHPEIHDLAVDFCRREIVADVDLSKLRKVWIAKEGNKALGIAGYVLRRDIPVIRAIDSNALLGLGKRMNDFFADNGVRGEEVTLFIGREKPEQRCPGWREALKYFEAKAGYRFLFTVK